MQYLFTGVEKTGADVHCHCGYLVGILWADKHRGVGRTVAARKDSFSPDVWRPPLPGYRFIPFCNLPDVRYYKPGGRGPTTCTATDTRLLPTARTACYLTYLSPYTATCLPQDRDTVAWWVALPACRRVRTILGALPLATLYAGDHYAPVSTVEDTLPVRIGECREGRT